MAESPHTGATGMAIGSRNSSPVSVNRRVCADLADWLRFRVVPPDQEEFSLNGFSPQEIGSFYLLLVAISHQTSPQNTAPLEGVVAGKHVRGWDYLSAKLEEAVRRNPTILSPQFWARTNASDLDNLFRDDSLGDRLTDTRGRSALIRDLGQKMIQRSWISANDIFEASGGRIDTGSPNLVNELAGFLAYRDPVRKKSYFFLALMRNNGVWTYKDSDRLGAPVDYHEVRGHLRIGTVEVSDPGLHYALVHGLEIGEDEDIAIRRAVHEALMFLSDASRIGNPSRLHYLFWNVFRSCCTRENPHCFSCSPTCSLPARYVPLALFPNEVRRCPFSPICQSAGREPKLREPIVRTDFY
jgi:hypothetical protein